MKQWLNSLSREVLAAGAILIGIFFIVTTDAPYNVCDSQMEIFEKRQRGFLYPRLRKKKELSHLGFDRLADICKTANGPGGCLEFILGMTKVVRQIQSAPKECQTEIMEQGRVSRGIWKSMDLLVRIAWGESVPESIYSKNAWLSSFDLKLFCDLKYLVRENYPPEDWFDFRDKYFKSLPGVKNISREMAWEKLLLSNSCRSF